MQPPAFWRAPPGLIAGLLSPAALLWNMAGRTRRALATPYRASVPVLCVGNLVAGGAGKTPIALSLAQILASRGVAVHVLSRGHGGSLARSRDDTAIRIEPDRHSAAEVGDEPLLLARVAPCWIGRDRAATARAAIDAGAQALLLDDGFQNPGLRQDLSMLVVDRAYGFGNGRIIPAGPLRESLAAGLGRADAVIHLATKGEAAPPPCALDLPRDITALSASLEPVAGDRFAGTRLLAFAGIGRPEKFFASLRGIGAELVATRSFADHRPYRPEEIARLHREAASAGATLVTTAKDLARLPPVLRVGIDRLDVAIRWHDPPALEALLAPVLHTALGATPPADGHAAP